MNPKPITTDTPTVISIPASWIPLARMALMRLYPKKNKNMLPKKILTVHPFVV